MGYKYNLIDYVMVRALANESDRKWQLRRDEIKKYINGLNHIDSIHLPKVIRGTPNIYS